jgi:ABC-type glycerol-3-phosphate transport system substrate-binding protein
MVWTIGINPASAHKEEAGIFMDFLAEKAANLPDKAKVIPGNGVSLAAYDPFYAKVWEIMIAGEAAQDFEGMPWIKLEKIFRQELSGLFAGVSSPANAAAAIQAGWEIVLKNFAD